MDNVFGRIVDLMPIPVLIAVALFGAAAWAVKEIESLPSLLATLRSPSLQASGFAILLGLTAYYGFSFILRQGESPKFAEHQRGVLVARFENDDSDRVQTHVVQGLRTALFDKEEFRDVEVRSANRILTEEPAARSLCGDANAIVCLWGVFIQPKTAHYIISTPASDIGRLLVPEFTDVTDVQNEIINVLGKTKPRARDPKANLAFLERSLAEEREARRQITEDLARLRDTLSRRSHLEPTGTDNNVTAVQTLRALVVGVSNYQHLPALPSPAQNALAVAEILKERGANVTVLIDPTRDQLYGEISKTAELSESSDQVWFYYSGHGAVLDGDAVLIPTDGDPANLLESTISTATLGSKLKNIRGEQGIIILDASFAGAQVTSIPSIGHPRAPFEFDVGDKDLAILSASQVGEPAYAVAGAQHSVFTDAFLQALTDDAKKPEGSFKTITELYSEINDSLLLASDSLNIRQEPFLSITGSSTDMVLAKPDAL